LIVTPTKEEVVKDLKEFKLKNKRQLEDEPRSSASSGLPAENESVNEDPKPKRAREEKCGCTDKCFCALTDKRAAELDRAHAEFAAGRYVKLPARAHGTCNCKAVEAGLEEHSFCDSGPCKLCDAPMCLK